MVDEKKSNLKYEEQMYTSSGGADYLQQVTIFLGDTKLCEMDGRTVSKLRDALESNANGAKSEIRSYIYSPGIKIAKGDWDKLVNEIAEKIKTYENTL